MKNIPIIAISALLLAGCGEESYDLTPTNKEVNWADQIDMTNPTSRAVYQSYGLGLITDFDVTRDVLYHVNYKLGISIDKFAEKQDKDDAIDYAKTNLFDYFTNDAFIRSYFPKKFYLARTVNVTATDNDYCPVAREGKWRIGEFYLYNTIHSMYMFSNFLMTVDLATINGSAIAAESYQKDNLFILWGYMIDNHDLDKLLGEDFYTPQIERYYGRMFNENTEYGRSGVWNDEGGSWADVFVAASWYYNKGFISTANINRVQTVGGQRMLWLRQENGVNYYMRFPYDRKEDLRQYIDVMMYLDRATWNLYPDIVKKRFKALVDKFDEWGYDFRRLNTMWNDVYPKQ